MLICTKIILDYSILFFPKGYNPKALNIVHEGIMHQFGWSSFLSFIGEDGAVAVLTDADSYA
jgi:hypothetical protein